MFGKLFNYSDRATFEALSDTQLEAEQSLPNEVSDDAVVEPCVTLE